MFFFLGSDSFAANELSLFLLLKCSTCIMIFCTRKKRFLTCVTLLVTHSRVCFKRTLKSALRCSHHFGAFSKCLFLYASQRSLNFPPKSAVVFSPAHSSCYRSTTYSLDSSDLVYKRSSFIIG